MSHIVKIISDGTHKGTELFIDDKPIDFKNIQFAGDEQADIDIVVTLAQGKITQGQIKREIDGEPQGEGVPLIGFGSVNGPDIEEDDEEDC